MPFIREQIDAKAGGTTVGTYTIDTANKTLIFNPPRAQQDAFVAFVEQSDKSKFELQEAIVRIDNLIKSLIQQDTE